MAPNSESSIKDFGTWRPTNFRYLTGELTDGANNTPFGSPLGGYVINMYAHGTLLLGDVVQMYTTNYQVFKSTTITTPVGVVVGGEKFPTSGKAGVSTNPAYYGVATAATDGRGVLVQILGLAQVVSDGTQTITAGDPIITSTTTAGQVTKGVAGFTATALVGSLVIAAGATPVTSTAANGAIITGAPTVTINNNGPANPIIGVAVTGATNVAGTVFTMLVQFN